ncbi:MAG: hypothetical protein VW270_05450 [Candidatus Poseidoniales archaeon]|jgi:hypothetical protein
MDIQGMLTDAELMLYGLAFIIADILIIYYGAKKLLPIWRKMKADGKITLDEIEDAVEEVIDIVEETKEKIEKE